MDIIIIGFLFATAKFCLICKFLPIRKVVRYNKWIDLFFTLVLPIMFAGTFSGMIVAVFSGLFLSLYLMVAKWVVGVEPLPVKPFRRYHRA